MIFLIYLTYIYTPVIVAEFSSKPDKFSPSSVSLYGDVVVQYCLMVI